VAQRDGGNGVGGNAGSREAQIVFVSTPGGLRPTPVRLGISDFDYAQVVDGLAAGDEVALLSVAELQAKRKQDQTRMQQRMGSGVPGLPGAPGGAAAGGRGASGGR
jgi:HlyD family secretion protein